MNSVVQVIAVVLALIAVIIAGPLLTIWALNTIFALAIPYSIAEWFAVVWLGIILHSTNAFK